QSNLFNWFFWTYNIGLILTAGMLAVRGTMTVVGSEPGPATAGISGLGHIFLTLGMVLLFLNLRTALKPHFRTGSGAPQVESSVLWSALLLVLFLGCQPDGSISRAIALVGPDTLDQLNE